MSDGALRFECVMEPNGRWMVWDVRLDLPAQFSALALIGLCHDEAVSLCSLLNETGSETGSNEARQSRAS
ncbi:MAG: hypothetical protein EOQ42_08900 [Mesorhizobium sp.]|uniref:hypothetical protein n=1 Tax=unclassified Mesorhizobium TaxID=325217 RepID=UPI000FE8B773|nr:MULTISPECIES: hypothetical protein [unclassified Mesorhizobium]RWB24658.1 MAG: hypothetical protein EOQ41_26295 [Mesorhizobium sp.]RWB29139.1 MAG: hypothetical protein EOQ43_20790 [Mesorhizobium sp.]RWB78090.1 MAG: hypothetical protein EOQ42_08900 [Mesorhizobium sp.]RWC08204.1 MAG: hypothetical protein EOS51_26050 [Mesorhizobium sp.]RWD11192.1 MAG: hypothetical protein EOS57_22055 [Mesorhizobium sp.]